MISSQLHILIEINRILLPGKDALPDEHISRELKQNRILLEALEKYAKTAKKKGRRDKLELYHDILVSIQGVNRVKPTKVQLAIKTSYDKFLKYVDELEENKLIQRQPLTITEKGKSFLFDYEKLMKYIQHDKHKVINF